MIITVAKHNYLSSNLLRNWRGEMPGLSVWVMPTVVRAELSRHLLVSPVTGARVTWAVADTVIIINATQCRAFSHLRLRSKSPGQWDKKHSFDRRTSDICGRDLMRPLLSVQSFYRQLPMSLQATHYMFGYTADKLLLDFNVSAWSQLNIWPPSKKTESLNRIHFNA